jgi:hypothetical protein
MEQQSTHWVSQLLVAPTAMCSPALPPLQDEHDWLPYNKDVYGKLKKYHDQGYKIVIFR